MYEKPTHKVTICYILSEYLPLICNLKLAATPSLSTSILIYDTDTVRLPYVAISRNITQIRNAGIEEEYGGRT